MQNILGTTPGGNNPRELTIWLGRDEPRLHLWMHAPEAGGGMEVRLDPDGLMRALETALAGQEEAPPQRDGPGSLLDYFQDGRWRQALRRYAQFAEESGWSILHRLELYGQARIAFDPAQSEAMRNEAFAYLYEALRGYWQVFRGASSHWDEEAAFAFFQTNDDDCGPQSVRTLESLSKSEMRKVVIHFLNKLSEMKTTVSGGYPISAASRFLHFYNPRLFPMFDNAVVNQQVLQVFGADFDTYCAESETAGWDDDAAFYARYVLWASRHIQLADPDLTSDFVTWIKAQIDDEEEHAEVLAEIAAYQGAMFEYVAIGATKLLMET